MKNIMGYRCPAPSLSTQEWFFKWFKRHHNNAFKKYYDKYCKYKEETGEYW